MITLRTLYCVVLFVVDDNGTRVNVNKTADPCPLYF